ncbi:MAG: hypothetical protein FWD27_00545 [Coriobacteriia bacterium]|nr:hypothetical protein [Coriobacteriia bacterium]
MIVDGRKILDLIKKDPDSPYLADDIATGIELGSFDIASCETCRYKNRLWAGGYQCKITGQFITRIKYCGMYELALTDLSKYKRLD